MKRTIEITLTPREIALEFSKMTDEQQARFFNHLSVITRGWSLARQMLAAANNDQMTPEGLAIMRSIGDAS